MDRDFDGWNIYKKDIHKNSQNRFYRPREIRWCFLGVNVGFEENGKGKRYQRPILIIRGFNRQVCWVVPLSTTENINKYLIDIGRVGEKRSKAIISHLKLIDTKRLGDKVGVLNKDKFEIVKKSIRDLLQ